MNICKCKKDRRKPIYTSEDPTKYLKKNQKRSFSLSAANTSSKFIIQNGNRVDTIIYMPRLKRIQLYHLGVISHVRARAKRQEPDQKIIDAFRYGDTFSFRSDEWVWKGYEIDIVSAYWREARIRELCSEEMFQKFLSGKGRKIARNMSIGALHSTPYRS